MTPEIMQRLEELFSAAPVLCAQEAVPSEEIDEAEKRIGIEFDSEYRTFIERFGGAMVGSLPILGLRQAEVMGSESAIEATERFRTDGWKPTELWVVISVDLAGNPIGLTSEGEVWVSDHDCGETRKVAPTFDDFLLQLLES